MRIYHSREPYIETCLQGSVIEMASLKDSILKFLKSDDTNFELLLDKGYDPKPYSFAFKKLIIIKSHENKIHIANESFVLTGTIDYWRIFVDNLLIDVDTVPYHVHFDYVSYPDLLSEDGPDIVIEASSFGN